MAHRLRRVYLPLLTFTLGAWAICVMTFRSQSWPESGAIGDILGVPVTVAAAAFYLVALIVSASDRADVTVGRRTPQPEHRQVPKQRVTDCRLAFDAPNPALRLL